MRKIVEEFYGRKLLMCINKRAILKQSRKGIVITEGNEDLLKGLQSEDLEKRITELGKDIKYYKDRLSRAKEVGDEKK